MSLLLPPFIKEKIENGIRTLSEDYGEVTILFCDICDFDKILNLKGKEIVEILDSIYR